jgi:hypothetical protein
MVPAEPMKAKKFTSNASVAVPTVSDINHVTNRPRNVVATKIMVYAKYLRVLKNTPRPSTIPDRTGIFNIQPPLILLDYIRRI